MKIKEVDRTANAAWSAANQYPIYLAVGTAAQQLDASFSTSSALEIFSVNLAEPGHDMSVAGVLPTDFRFHKLVWGSSDNNPTGLLVGGADHGNISVWNPTGLITGESSADEALVHKMTKHTGAVLALDLNPFQKNLLASGASDSEIFIWDMNKPDSPMTPGTKSQPPDDVTSVAWNRQVQHILASTYSGRCVVWDLRKNEPIIKVSDSMSRIKSKLVEWHPEVATQLCLSSEDDHTPVIQLWDLRFATSPLKVLEHHQRGVLSMAWCPQDPDLLLSCGKDNHILCWNPNSSNSLPAEVVYELSTNSQWCFDVKWCPRNPSLISTCSFDGHVSIYSLMGGSSVAPTSNKVIDAFPSDPFAAPLIQPETPASASGPMIKKVPKWLRRPAGASFAFGGKLVVFENSAKSQTQNAPQRLVSISQVVTEAELVERSTLLERTLSSGLLADFCARKITESNGNKLNSDIWQFLKVHFEKDPRSHYLELLGHDKKKLTKLLAEQETKKSRNILENGTSPGKNKEEQDSDEDFLGKNNSSEGDIEFDKIAADHDHGTELTISVADGYEGLVTRALLSADFESAVNLCFNNGRTAEAILLAVAGGQDLLTRIQRRFFDSNKDNLNKLISSIVTRDFERVIQTCELQSWGEALAVILTYARAEEFARLADLLATRLEASDDPELAANASLCYICSGNLDRLVDCVQQLQENSSSPLALQDLVEKVMVLRRSLENSSGRAVELGNGSLALSLVQYAELLASQGSLQTALSYLSPSSETSVAILRHRLYKALGGSSSAAPSLPFQVLDVKGSSVAATPTGGQASSTPRVAPQLADPLVAPRELGGLRQPSHSGRQQLDMPVQSQAPRMSGVSTYQPPAGNRVSGNIPNYGVSGNVPNYGVSGNIPNYGVSGNVPNYGAPVPTYPAQRPNVQPQIQAQPGMQGGTSFQPVPAQAGQVPGGTPSQPGGSMNTQRFSTPVSNTQPYQDVSRAGGWNDPPVIRPRPVVPTSQAVSAPTSIFYPTPAETVPAQLSFQPRPGFPSQPYQTGPGQQYPSYPSVPTYNPNQNTDSSVAPGYPNAGVQSRPSIYNPHEHQQPSHQPVATVKPVSEPPKPIVKADIPKEQLIIQEVFDKLVDECQKHANNTATKKKLEDVSKKLEMLYDKLRENALSGSVLQGLHQIIQSIQQFDYQSALGWHTQLVSHGNFSEISSFMPGLKILLQTAAQNQVYLQ